MKIPAKIPEKGFYYHYKHDPAKGLNDAAYEVSGTAWDTESANVHSNNPEDFIKKEMVIYKPLYKESLVYKNGKRFWIRPIEMFLENITKENKTFPRFQKITDEKVIAELQKIKGEMYP